MEYYSHEVARVVSSAGVAARESSLAPSSHFGATPVGTGVVPRVLAEGTRRAESAGSVTVTPSSFSSSSTKQGAGERVAGAGLHVDTEAPMYDGDVTGGYSTMMAAGGCGSISGSGATIASVGTPQSSAGATALVTQVEAVADDWAAADARTAAMIGQLHLAMDRGGAGARALAVGNTALTSVCAGRSGGSGARRGHTRGAGRAVAVAEAGSLTTPRLAGMEPWGVRAATRHSDMRPSVVASTATSDAGPGEVRGGGAGDGGIHVHMGGDAGGGAGGGASLRAPVGSADAAVVPAYDVMAPVALHGGGAPADAAAGGVDTGAGATRAEPASSVAAAAQRPTRAPGAVQPPIAMFRAPVDCAPPPMKPPRARYVAAAEGAPGRSGGGGGRGGGCRSVCCGALVLMLLLLVALSLMVTVAAVAGVCAVPGRCDSAGFAARLADLRLGSCHACSDRGT